MNSRKIRAVIIQLLRHLPDSSHDDDESWDWCWNELSNDAQEAVRSVRRKAVELIEVLSE